MLVANLRDADVDAVVELWRSADLVRPWNDPHADLRLAQRAASSAVFVGHLPGRVVASIVTGFDGHRGWLYYLAVSAAHQRQGFGREMVRTAERWLRRAGAPKVELMVRADNAATAGFYAALGYQRQDVVVLGKWLR